MSSNGMPVLVGGAWDEHQRNIDDAINRAYGLPTSGDALGAPLYQPFAPDAAADPVASTGPSGAAGLQPGGGSWYNFTVPNPASIPSAAPPLANAPVFVSPSQSDGAGSSGGSGDQGVGEYYLPGVGQTYLSPEFADRLGRFIAETRDDNIPLEFISGYRDPHKQAALRNDPTATTPAENSLHSTGHATDISPESWSHMDAAMRAKVIANARDAGLSWGGKFSTPDPRHFFLDPGGDRRQRIGAFSQNIKSSQNKIPDY